MSGIGQRCPKSQNDVNYLGWKLKSLASRAVKQQPKFWGGARISP